MSSEWVRLAIGDCLERVVDNRGKTPPLSEEETEFALIEINSIVGGSKNPDYSVVRKYVTPETYESWFRSGHPTIGDVLFSTVGSIAEVAIFNGGGGCVAQNLVGLRPKRDVIHPDFLYYSLINPKTRSRLKTLDISSVQPSIKVPHLLAAEITVPSLAVQKEVCSVLSLLDDRISLLRETNATLEAIAQALFKSWFVDFDPVRANMEGRSPEGMDEATAALFPDSFEESELGLVPRGWSVGTVEDICQTITNGGTPNRSKKTYWDGGEIPWFKTGDFSDGFLLTPTERITPSALECSAAKLLPENAVLMAIYAAPTVGRLGVLTEPAAFNQACTGMVAHKNIGPWFLYWTLYFGRDWFNSRANGAAQQNISKAIVSGYKVVIPSDAALAAFNDVVAPLQNKIRANSEQAKELGDLRDTLLPRLISGKLRLLSN